ncbi:hypothetical protein BV20DRAFT_944003 [Pilatotrama ljubarskyi]|nr:hypothetical protein BV20DRAFT_944003 [Pilatotrama ljubarskyi]
MLALSLIPFLMAVPVTVKACEGDCIVGITNAFIGNYTDPIHTVMTSIAQQISDMLPGHPGVETAMRYVQPLLSTYQQRAYHGMENAIFPSYFHGKCLDSQGVEPDGCPNPDCPIVCGTPGSLVHFYPKLRFMAYNQTYHLLQELATPGTDTYKQVEQAVMDAAASSPGDRRRGYSRIYSRELTDATLVPVFLKRAQDVQAGLRSIMAQIHGLLGDACGANGVEETNGLPKCNWEAEMKAYILSFP